MRRSFLEKIAQASLCCEKLTPKFWFPSMATSSTDSCPPSSTEIAFQSPTGELLPVISVRFSSKNDPWTPPRHENAF